MAARRIGPKVTISEAEHRALKLTPPPSPLTTRQVEILGLVAAGLDAPTIARKLWLSPNTVKGHQRIIRESLACHTLAQCVAVAFRLGLLQ
jgi:DNA-binding NarL/FixJ family response regulator